MKKSQVLYLTIGIIFGVIITLSGMPFFSSTTSISPKSEQGAEDNAPLYWVAPMDPNYRRDQPGKSPMGMDLVPVYADDVQGSKSSLSQPGAVQISPDVVNNLGVRTSPVLLAPWQSSIETVGYVKYDEDHLIHIHPRVSGWVETLHIKAAGEEVTQGQPLYSLYSPELVNAQEEYLLAEKSGNAALAQAAINRLASLQFPDSVLKKLQAQKKVMQTVEFNAPQSGVVDALKIREGYYVIPGTTLMSIASLDEVWVEAEVFERQASDIHLGMPVSMTLDYLPGKHWQGSLDYIYPKLNAQLRTLRVRLRFTNSDGLLKPNMYAQIVMHSDDSQPVLQVPYEAVIRTGKQDRVVLQLAPGQFKSVEVQIGRVSDSHIEILSGLHAEDLIVTSAQFLLDSESNISSDFKRMNHHDKENDKENAEENDNQATVDGLINAVDVASRTVNIHRDAIEKWQRPAMTMDFRVAETVNINQFVEGERLQFTFMIENGNFIIIDAPHKHPGGQQ